VLPPIDVWLVDGTVSDRPLQSDTDFLAVALSPFSLAGEKAVDLFRTSKVSARELHSQKDELPRVVVLADVGALRSEVSTWLSDFVENKGGTLIMFAGPATDDTVYDKQLLGSDGRSILPMTWGDVRELDASGSGAKIDESQMTYPPLASFSRDAKGTLESVGVTAYRAMKPRPKVEADEAQKPEAAVTPETQAEADKDAKKSDVNVVMRLANGDPLMVVSDVGKGRVLQVATTANDRWTSLPRRLAFVPLVQRLMMHLATGENRVVTPSAGEPIVIDLPKTMETSGDVAGAKKPDDKQTDGAELTWTVTTPAGKTMPAASDKEKVRFGETDLVGIYRFESSDGQVVYSAINVPEAELKRTPSDSAVRDDAAKRVGATRYATLEAYSSDDSTRRFGRGIWRYMLLALLAAMILEPVIQQRGARVTS
jgi:hypothetical protein